MCRYGQTSYKTHWVCTGCRLGFKQDPSACQGCQEWRPCPACHAPMTEAGRDLEVPRRGDDRGWRALTAVLDAGLRFDDCGCNGPGYRPRTPAAVRERMAVAERFGVAPAKALGRRELEKRLSRVGRS